MKLLKEFTKKNGLYIDLGTENTLIYSRGQGWVLNEPSFVTFKEKQNSRELIAIGRASKNHLGRTPINIGVGRPLNEGVIADFDATERMLHGFLMQLKMKTHFYRPEMIISLPCRVTEYERRAVVELGRAVGARKVQLIDEPMAAAIGAGLPVIAPRGQIIVDIGGGTTEIAIISLGGVAYANAVRTGGHDMDKKIIQHLRNRFNILIGESTAEKLKIKFSNALPSDSGETINFNAVDLLSGLPKMISLQKNEIGLAIQPVVQDILKSILTALSEAPPEIAADISDSGIWLAGGGALIKNLPQAIAAATGLKVQIARDPLFSVARGGAYLLEHPEVLEKVS